MSVTLLCVIKIMSNTELLYGSPKDYVSCKFKRYTMDFFLILLYPSIFSFYHYPYYSIMCLEEIYIQTTEIVDWQIPMHI